MVNQYTDTELKTIANAPMMVGIAISMNMNCDIKQFVDAGKKYPNNSVIQAVFSEENLKSGVIKPEKPEISPEEVKSGALLEKAIAATTDAVTLLEGKATPEEVAEYKQFIYSCGEAVAEAAGSGLFGSGNPKVSPDEAVALSRLKTALGV